MNRIYTTLIASLCSFLALFSSAEAQTFEWAKLSRSIGADTANIYHTLPYKAVKATTSGTGTTYISQAFADTLKAGAFTVVRNTFNAGAFVCQDSTGRVLWAYLWENLEIQQMAADDVNGGFYLIGSTRSHLGGTWRGSPWPLNDNFLAKISATGALLWCQQLPAYYNTSPSISADRQGNCYVVGDVSGSIQLGGVTLGNLSLYVMQVSLNGNIQWVREIHSSGSQYGGIIGPSPSGGCLVTETFAGTAYFGAGTTVPSYTGSRTGYNVFIANYDINGVLLWKNGINAAPVSGTTNTYQPIIFALAADLAGNCYAVGDSTWASGPIGPAAGTPYALLVAKFDAQGVFQWKRTSINPYSPAFFVAVDRAGGGATVALTPYDTVPINTMLGPLTLSKAAFNFVHYDALGRERWSNSETYQNTYYVSSAGTSYYGSLLSVTAFNADARGNIYCVGIAYDDDIAIQSSPTLLLGPFTLRGFGAAVCRISASANTVLGQVYVDQNGNGRRDIGENTFPTSLSGQLTQGGNTSYFPVRSAGELQAYCQSGSYVLSIANIPTHYQTSQPINNQYNGSFTTGFGGLDVGRDFGMVPIANQLDLRVTLVPYGNVRPGVTTRYQLVVENVGTIATPTGTVTLVLDSRTQYISSSPLGNSTGQTITWSYSALNPFEKASYDIQFNLPFNLALGTILNSTATAPLTNDLVPSDNTITLRQTVTNSADPNYISVNYAQITPSQVAAAQPLDYTIHFQNIGTGVAYTVAITDTLNFRRLNISSLFVLAQSHNCIWSLNNQGDLVIRFLNINLPSRTTDVINSQGFITFRVAPNTNLSVGDIIPNRCSIVFDFNAPLATNTATTVVLMPAAVFSNHTALAWDTYPNPARSLVTITADLPSAGTVTLQLLDALGRLVQQRSLVAPAGAFSQALDVSPLAPGLYVLRLRLPNGTVRTRQVVRE